MVNSIKTILLTSTKWSSEYPLQTQNFLARPEASQAGHFPHLRKYGYNFLSAGYYAKPENVSGNAKNRTSDKQSHNI